ncbi:hypothetical protein KFL_003970100 [Klebsormidium nitens]|uniref:Uncharacterized protein n=1 Tax=Klebsormidium nitens TaxID=105231 RepID=A0A1Y1IBV5_KLENI|nr:hypothetical protein KFL_003970100 [Klebsormidium nitens]|eukprot:GAQ88063.1 hypothetical protein KFL_003970100 [Klebsormidium nitens]
MECFSGMMHFADGKKLTPQQFQYLMLFCNIPRFKRNVELLKSHSDPLREAVGLPLGEEGEYFVSSQEYEGLSEELKEAVRNFSNKLNGVRWYNGAGISVECETPAGVPDLYWCHWRPSTTYRGIKWIGYFGKSITFFHATEWMQWISKNILQKWGLRLEGEIWYQGENRSLTGRFVATTTGKITKQDARSSRMQNLLGAAARNDVALAKSLPRAQLTRRDAFGRTPLMLAACFEAYEMLEWLTEQSSSEELYLDQAKCTPGTMNGLDFEKETLFHLLARLDLQNPAFQRALKHLSAHPVPPEALSSFTGEHLDGPTPLGLAIERGNRVFAEWLIAKGADVNFHGWGFNFNPEGESYYSYPLMTAAAVEDPYFVELLLNKGARIDCENEPRQSLVGSTLGKMTPLQLAAYMGRFENVRLLAYYGARFEDTWLSQFTTSRDDPEDIAELTAQTVRQGVIYRDYSKPWKSAEALKDALKRFDAAAREGLSRRRLLVVSGMTRRTVPRLPEHLLKHVMELAGLFPVVQFPEDRQLQARAEKSIAKY